MKIQKSTDSDRTVIINGILEAYNKFREHKFRLITPDGIYNLEVPEALIEVLKKHQWERFYVKGEKISESILLVKKIFMESEDEPLLFDISKKFDLSQYQGALKKGFYLAPQF